MSQYHSYHSSAFVIGYTHSKCYPIQTGVNYSDSLKNFLEPFLCLLSSSAKCTLISIIGRQLRVFLGKKCLEVHQIPWDCNRSISFLSPNYHRTWYLGVLIIIILVGANICNYDNFSGTMSTCLLCHYRVLPPLAINHTPSSPATTFCAPQRRVFLGIASKGASSD